MRTQILSLTPLRIILTGLAFAYEDHDKEGGKPDAVTLVSVDTISVNGGKNIEL